MGEPPIYNPKEILDAGGADLIGDGFRILPLIAPLIGTRRITNTMSRFRYFWLLLDMPMNIPPKILSLLS